MLKTTLNFLTSLKANNNRDWFTDNKSEYLEAKSQFEAFVGKLIIGIKEFDSTIGSIEPKDCVFRIYRDVRFSHNKEPYKTNMGAYITKAGRKGSYAGYYFHTEPEGSFVSGGIYMAQPAVMKEIREDMDTYSDEFLAIVNEPKFAKTFSFFADETLKRVPQGFSKESPVAEYLKLKHISPHRPMSNNEMCSDTLLEQALDMYRVMNPLIAFINRPIAEMEG